MWIRSRFSRVAGTLFAAALMSALPPATARADDPNQAAPDPHELERQRAEFQKGMDFYLANQMREAIDAWRPIYAKLGPHHGYRLAYNLGIAYQELGDATHAAEHYVAFLRDVDARARSVEGVEALVKTEKADAQSRLDGLRAAKGRIITFASKPPVEVQIDDHEPRLAGFDAYVAPGQHTVKFSSGAPSKSFPVAAGEHVDVPTPQPPPEPPPPPRLDPRPPKQPTVHEIEHPFPIAVLYVAGAVSVATVIAPVLTYNHAASLKTQHDAQPAADPTSASIESSYDSVRSTAYLTLAIPITLAVATSALTAWYFFGKKERDVPLPFVGPVQSGGIAGFAARF